MAGSGLHFELGYSSNGCERFIAKTHRAKGKEIFRANFFEVA